MTHSKYNTEDILKILSEKNITLLDKYINTNVKTKLKCNICEYVWDGRIGNIIHGQGCYVCGRLKIKKASSLNLNFVKTEMLKYGVTLLEDCYSNAKTKMLCKCNTCNYEWKVNYDNIQRKKRSPCPNCKKIKTGTYKRLPIRQVEDYLKNKSIKLISAYINSKTPIICECIHCGFIWKSSGLNYIKNYDVTCQNCNKQSNLSEKICRYIFEKIFNKKFIKTRIKCYGVGGGPLELDGYCEELKLAFEHNGPQHYSPKNFGSENSSKTNVKFDDQIKNDNIKKEWCKENGISLIIIKELGKYTTEKNIKEIILENCIKHGIELPDSFYTLDISFKDIKSDIQKICDGKSDIL